MSDDDLLDLLEQSRDRNKRLGVTGMLLYGRGNFFQVLEGEQEDVEAIYRSIVRDKRNTGNLVVAKGPILERNFPGWWMGFRRLENGDLEMLDGYSDFLTRDMDATEFARRSDVVVSLLYQFKRSN